MTRQASITAMAKVLDAAVTAGDLRRAERAVERLKSIAIDAVSVNDPAAIQRVRFSLQRASAFLEAVEGSEMEFDSRAFAWRLRADVATAILADRACPKSMETTVPLSLREKILEVLRGSNEPCTNKQISERLDKDQGLISKYLRALAQAGKIQQWKSGVHVFNVLPTSGDTAELNRQIFSQDLIKEKNFKPRANIRRIRPRPIVKTSPKIKNNIKNNRGSGIR